MEEKQTSGENKEGLTPDSERSKYGFDFYPERRNKKEDFSFWDKLNYRERGYNRNRYICERNVFNAFKSNELLRIMVQALKEAGCPLNLRRHVVCEDCDSRVTGGYDTEYNQIVICQNISKSRKHPEGVLLHELIHMYDHCVSHIDFKNLDNLACTEIRAANIAHCSFLSSLLLGQSSFINIKKTHQYCVKIKAAQTIMLSRNLDFPSAMEHVLNVFDKCYNDLEPIGRRMRRNSIDPLLAYREAQYYSYYNKEE